MLGKIQQSLLIKSKDRNLRRCRGVIFCVILLFLICRFLTGCAVEKGKVYEKDGKLYGKTDGLFKAKWDDYYLRGLSYGEGGFWEDAASDFMVAIQRRSGDQRRARTYGLHFINYFPNRELGIAYFNLAKFKEAIQALEASLANVESARAKFYLNKARRAWLNETRLDTIPPAVSVQFPPPIYRTNDFSISVRGTANDDFFISNIIFNGRSSELELSRKEVSFREEFSLHHGKNVITLQSEDILGKTSTPVTIQVKVDREGPLVFLEVQGSGGNTVKVTGAVYDKSAIAKIILNERVLVFKETKLVAVNEHFGGLSLATDVPIQFEAEDVVGNRTTGSIKTSSSKTSINLSHHPCIAFAKSSRSSPSLPVMTLPQATSFKHLAAVRGPHVTSETPAIDLEGLRDGQTMFFNTLSVEGAVLAAEGIQDLTVNEQSLLSLEESAAYTSFIKLLKEKKGRPLAFSKTIQLKEGGNAITTTLADVTGEVTKKAITITRRIPKVRQIGSRMTVATFPFTEKKRAKEALRNYVYTFLTHSFVDQKRFNVLGRDKLNRVLDEQQMSQEAIFDQEAAIRLGHLMESEAVLIGEISASKESIEIFARLVDTESSFVFAEDDVYWEGGLDAGFREILDRLALKFKRYLPLCEGTVIDEKSGKVTISLGEDQSIHQGMRFLAFQESDPVYDLVTGMNLGRDTEVLGLLSTKEINQEFSKADILEKFTGRGIQAGDKVISK